MQISAKRRNRRGYAISEMAASIAFFVPLITMMLYGVWQMAQYALILNSLSEAARTAARNCAIAYGAPATGAVGTGDSQGPNAAPPQPTTIFSSPATTVIEGGTVDKLYPPASPNQAFSSVRIAGIVESNSQFKAYYTPPSPNNQDPSYSNGRVNVVVTYQGAFPKPDLFGISALMPNFKIQRACSYPLEY